MLFCTFLCRHCTTTTWKYLTSRFVEDVSTRQRLSFSFPELWYCLLEFNSGKNCQHLTNWTRWNKRDKVGRSATWLFKSRFLSRRRRRCWSLMLKLPYNITRTYCLENCSTNGDVSILHKRDTAWVGGSTSFTILCSGVCVIKQIESVTYTWIR